ncbi:MAG: LacI family DNA-binding transcriptional regulator [Chitinophagaceae bacterium]|nr:LacI family DNA-binding transcriptional regulator [Chitinophagaceae bacterium]
MGEQHLVTIKDISRRLKISVSTVSRALRGGTEIKKETRELVRQVAAELNYQPNSIALSLKEKRTKVIGVIVPEIANNFCSSTIAGIEEIAYSRGYYVTIFQSHERYGREVTNTQLLTARRVDGVIISVSNETNRYDHLLNLIQKDIPLVMFDRVCSEINTHKVVVNDYAAAFNATEHLIKQGHTDIAHITIADFLSITQNRKKGYEDALKKYKIPAGKRRTVHCSFDAKEMDRAIRAIFNSPNRPTAILASVERIAIACLTVLKEMNLSIPEDVAIIGFSDNPLNNILKPSLSCIRQPTYEIGKKSAELLIDLIEQKGAGKKFHTVQLDTVMDIMESSVFERKN